jgi:hypothetical protein
MKSENITLYIFNLLIGIIGFFLVTSFNRLNTEILRMTKEITSLKLEITELNAKIVTEEKVTSIVDYQLMKHGIQ